MRRNRRYALVVGAIVAVAALAIGGVGHRPGSRWRAPRRRSRAPAAEQAKAAALDAAGGGTVLEIEQQDGDGAGVYEVEVRRTDGSTVEIHLDSAVPAGRLGGGRRLRVGVGRRTATRPTTSQRRARRTRAGPPSPPGSHLSLIFALRQSGPCVCSSSRTT